MAIELEIPESAIVADVRRAATVCLTLREVGARITIDRFALGGASIGYLKSVAVDTVKIDRSFVRNLPNDRRDAAFVAAFVTLAHGLDIETIASGVETEEHARRLAELGCDRLQGFRFGKPAPIEAWSVTGERS